MRPQNPSAAGVTGSDFGADSDGAATATSNQCATGRAGAANSRRCAAEFGSGSGHHSATARAADAKRRSDCINSVHSRSSNRVTCCFAHNTARDDRPAGCVASATVNAGRLANERGAGSGDRARFTAVSAKTGSTTEFGTLGQRACSRFAEGACCTK